MEAKDKAILCNKEVAKDFLEILHPNRARTLTAIWRDGVDGLPAGKPKIITRTFSAENVEECLTFIQKGNDSGWNIYALANTAKGMPSKKPKKEDIAEINWLYVDIDPRVGEPLDEERERILKILSSPLPNGIPEPTLITDSGSGYWVFWKIEPSIKL